MRTEVTIPAKRPYVAPVLERIDLAVNTQAGGANVTDGPTTKNAS
jgi:hypothetical protein